MSTPQAGAAVARSSVIDRSGWGCGVQLIQPHNPAWLDSETLKGYS